MKKIIYKIIRLFLISLCCRKWAKRNRGLLYRNAMLIYHI